MPEIFGRIAESIDPVGFPPQRRHDRKTIINRVAPSIINLGRYRNVVDASCIQEQGVAGISILTLWSVSLPYQFRITRDHGAISPLIARKQRRRASQENENKEQPFHGIWIAQNISLPIPFLEGNFSIQSTPLFNLVFLFA